MAYTFDQYSGHLDPDKETCREITVDDDTIASAAEEVFRQWCEEESITVAIELACGSFWKEGEANAMEALLNPSEYNFWNYLKENTNFFESEEVCKVAEEKAIDQDDARAEQAYIDRMEARAVYEEDHK